MIIEFLSPVFENSAPFILEQLEERIVLDGAIEATAGTWDAPVPGEGIFDGGFHDVEGRTFVFLDGLGAGVGIGYWWNPEIKSWGWGFDYESGWWWEDRGSGWDWMNVGWWDFEWYANEGICVFDGQSRVDWDGFEFVYDQAEDEIVYSMEGDPYMKYELGSAGDTGWGWYRRGKVTILEEGWLPWRDADGDSYAVHTSSYSGYSAELLYTGEWRPLPGGHGDDWVYFLPEDDLGNGGRYWFSLDWGQDFALDARGGASAAPTGWNTGWNGATSDWTYIGDSLMVFQSAGTGGVDQQWTVYDGANGMDDAWFTYRCMDWDNSTAWGSWDFNGGLDLAFLSGALCEDGSAYSSNEAYLKTNVIGVVGDPYDNATLPELVSMMEAISQSQGSTFFRTVMFHGTGADVSAESFTIGSEVVSESTLGCLQSSFEEMAGLLLGDGDAGQVHLMNAYAADVLLQPTLETIQGFMTGHGPWGALNAPILWASVDATGDWNGAADAQPNWALEWSQATFQSASPYANALGLDALLYGTAYTVGGSTELSGDRTTDWNHAPELTGDGSLTAITEDDTDNGGETVADIVGAAISDIDSGALEGIALFGLTATNGLWEYSLDSGSTWFAVGAVDQCNALLLRSTDLIRFTPNGEDGGSGAIDYYAWDRATGTAGGTADVSGSRGGTTAFSLASASATITATAVNDDPTQTLTPVGSVDEDSAPVDLGSAFSVDDVDGDNVTVTLTATAGFSGLTVTDNPDVTVTNNGTALITIAGSVADVKGVLATLEGALIGDFNGSAAVTISTDDGNGGAAGPEGLSVTVQSANDAPILSGDGSFTSITEDSVDNPGQTVADIVGSTITDVDSGALEGIAIFGLTATNGLWEYSLDNGSTWTAVGAVNPVNALLLRSTDLIRFTPNEEDGGSGSIDYHAWDQTSGAAGAKVDASEREGITSFSESAASASIAVSEVNDAPTVTVVDMPPIPCDICEIDLSQAIRVDDVDSSTLSVSLHSAGWFGCLTVSELPNVTIEGNGSCQLTVSGSTADVNAVLATLEGMRIGAAAGDGPIHITVSDDAGAETHAALTVTSPVDPAAPCCTVTPLDPVNPGCGEVDLGSVFSIDEGCSGPTAMLIHCAEGFTSVTLEPTPGVMVTTSDDGSVTGLYSMDPAALQIALNTLWGGLAADFSGDASIVFIVSDGVTVTCYAFHLDVRSSAS